jgi:RNA polymerase sigma factor (TIGR02999 family)
VRARSAERRGGGALRVTLNTSVGDSVAHDDDELLRVHEALEDLLQVDPRLGKVVQMRFFAGLSEREIADCLGVTERTVQRDWQKARLFLASALSA